MTTLLQDLRYALRILAKSPAFTAIAVLTLALGIGANTAIFSVVQGVLLASLPYRQAGRLVLVAESNERFPEDAISYPNFLDWQRTARSFQQMTALMGNQGFDLTAPGTPEHLNGQRLSTGFFSTIGATLALGRDFSPQEDRQGGRPVVIISNRLWRERFASSRDVLGTTITLDGIEYSIVGVAPAGFRPFDYPQDVFVPIGQGNPLILDARGSHDDIVAIARLNPGVSIGEARAEMSTIQDHLDELYPDANRGTGATVRPFQEVLVSRVRGTLLLLLSAVGLLLLIACANVANLLLARSAARGREFAIRSALGASRSRIIQQLITESVLLSLAGGTVGVLLAKWCAGVVLAAVPGSVPRTQSVGLNGYVLLFAVGITFAVGILFGLAPALKGARADVQSSLKEGGRGSTAGHHRLQSMLVMGQMALTLILLVGAGLLFRTIRQLWQTNSGFDTHHLIAFQVGLSPSVTKTGAGIRAGFQQLLERIRAIPGVQAADFTTSVPLSGEDNDAPFWINSQKPPVVQNASRMMVFNTGPDFIRTMGIPLLRGRFFTTEDTTKSPCVAVIDSDFAETYFKGQNPIGQTLTYGWSPPWGPCPIVGVVGHVKHFGLDEPAGYTRAESYYPLYQVPDKWWPVALQDISLVVRTRLDVATAMGAIKSVVYGAGDQTVYNIETLQQIAFDSMSSQRFPMILLGAFAVLALVLASIGIYGVISYSVSQRVHEIGIRMALGAERRNIFALIIRQGFRLALAGLAVGIAAALILARLLSSFSHLLYGVGASDPFTLIAVSLLLLAVAVLACYIPARRAMRVDPMEALRYE
jgi:predicted permease